MTLREAVTRAAAALASQPELRVDANRDAELLLLHVLNTDRTVLIKDAGRAMTPVEQRAYEMAVARRIQHEPVQYITGEQEFYGLAMKVSPAVLIPRPETEHLVEAALARVSRREPVRIADVGTGSGAIAIALAANLPLAQVTALDLSREALIVAQENARRHGVAGRVRLVESDLLRAAGEVRFDAVVSNPPYVAEAERATLARQVRDHEPAQALFAGAEGLDVYRRLIPQAARALRCGGLLAMEIGFGQSEAVAALLGDWNEVEFVADLRGIARVAITTKR
jgi:release factor glutamine methyltransferase